MKEEKRYTIGQMAELCHVSKRILRYYDQNGIVIPACRDKSTNYRYYTESQIDQILFLQELRELSLPVKTIGRLFPDRDLITFETELEQHLKELKEEIADLQAKYDRTLDVFLRVVRGRVAVEDIRRTPDAQIRLVHYHKRMVAFTRQTGVWDSGRRYISSRSKLLQILGEHQFSQIGSHMAMFSLDCLTPFRSEAAETGFEYFVEVQEGKSSSQCKVVEEFDAVSCVHTGSYEKLDDCYREMEQFARENDIALKGTAIEEYLVGSAMTGDPDQYVTRLYLPIQE